jgi:hypothetical protein
MKQQYIDLKDFAEIPSHQNSNQTTLNTNFIKRATFDNPSVTKSSLNPPEYKIMHRRAKSNPYLSIKSTTQLNPIEPLPKNKTSDPDNLINSKM